ncbi:hypothetical protein QBD01_001382 [Ochrobactrum sp. 19YEA23]|nr:hypothetical protein [Ochrobactrum sp. 19YEA23]
MVGSRPLACFACDRTGTGKHHILRPFLGFYSRSTCYKVLAETYNAANGKIGYKVFGRNL